MQSTYKWITDNYEFWQKICRVNNKVFRSDELGEAFQTLHKLANNSPDFEIIFLVFLTEYQNDLPFFKSLAPL